MLLTRLSLLLCSSLVAYLLLASAGSVVQDDPYCRAVSRPAYWERQGGPRLHLPGVVAHESRWCVDAEQVWETTITINDHGRRVTPAGGDRVVLAMGGSFTFGWGVMDGETWPAQLVHASGWTVANAGVSGQGALDAAAQLRRGDVVADLGAVDLVIYAAIEGHELRCLRDGLPMDPWYVQQVKGLRDAVARRWPTARFVVVSWPRMGLHRHQVRDLLEAGIDVVSVPGSVARGQLHQYDRHPSAEEYASVARWLAEEAGI